MDSHDLPMPANHVDSGWFQRLQSALKSEAGTGELLLTMLRDGTGLVAIFPIVKRGERNARIVNCSGVVRCVLEVPDEFSESGYGFQDAYYVANELTAIHAVSTRDFAFVVDEANGKILRSYEMR